MDKFEQEFGPEKNNTVIPNNIVIIISLICLAVGLLGGYFYAKNKNIPATNPTSVITVKATSTLTSSPTISPTPISTSTSQSTPTASVSASSVSTPTNTSNNNLP